MRYSSAVGGTPLQCGTVVRYAGASLQCGTVVRYVGVYVWAMPDRNMTVRRFESCLYSSS